MKKILVHVFIILLACSCGENRISARYSIARIIINGTDHTVKLNMYTSSGDVDDVMLILNPLDSAVFDAGCTVVGGDVLCSENGVFDVYASSLEDSVHVIFDDKKIIRCTGYYVSGTPICFGSDTLDRNIIWRGEGYVVEGSGTSQETYTYTITEEDYENAEPIEN